MTHTIPLAVLASMSVAAQNNLVFEHAGFNVGSRGGRYPERARYAERYGQRYGERYGIGQRVATQYCLDLSTGTVKGSGPLAGFVLPQTSYGLSDDGTIAHVDIAGDASIAMPVCGRGLNASGSFAWGGNGGGTVPPGGQPGGPTPGWNDDCADSITPGGGRPWVEGKGSCKAKPARCNCHVIGGNTLTTNGIPAGQTAAVQIDAGDAQFFMPYYIHVTAFEVGASTSLSVDATTALPVLLADSRSGREPNLRRANVGDPALGIITTVYGQRKEIECVDWQRFASINNQQLTLTFRNINSVAVHVFTNLWGLPGGKRVA